MSRTSKKQFLIRQKLKEIEPIMENRRKIIEKDRIRCLAYGRTYRVKSSMTAEEWILFKTKGISPS